MDDAEFAAHRAADPHCTCNDCVAAHFEPPQPQLTGATLEQRRLPSGLKLYEVDVLETVTVTRRSTKLFRAVSESDASDAAWDEVVALWDHHRVHEEPGWDCDDPDDGDVGEATREVDEVRLVDHAECDGCREIWPKAEVETRMAGGCEGEFCVKCRGGQA